MVLIVTLTGQIWEHCNWLLDVQLNTGEQKIGQMLSQTELNYPDNQTFAICHLVSLHLFSPTSCTW